MNIARAGSLQFEKGKFEPAVLRHEKALLSQIEFLRLDATRRLKQTGRGELGQFLTPQPVAQMMASMFVSEEPIISILDAGAGVGTLFAACVAEFSSRRQPPKEIKLVAYEIDPLLVDYLKDTLTLCCQVCEEKKASFISQITVL